ncbi:DUF916 and DUF3324 domain-containing protein [Vagococcus xieshaowenii]|uniref:DUF916 and DUF3324 domain-containing protein n=1 Tax=Vagococcus xieshaowenii TaxID=2562451 RepID=A0AAJ5EGX9_9ENTE|nr:DUF916 and DUF3324 domain-containing protein [Vagococcus xieshaowenii]QCA29696.1 DUF916 and DUF3324 domain-containing protein [Vagococcus xieshaowenii]TFZ42911.1 DUF916 and DUF3324 domain-containing protein [Vagococcus xieshaowenii]
MKKILWLVGLLALISSIPKTYEAIDLTTEFSVNIVTPENQIDNQLTYFDIQTKAGSTEVLEVVLKNNSNTTLKIRQTLSTAITNSNGVVDYSKINAKKDNSLSYRLQDISELEELILLAPLEEKKIKVTISLPKDVPNGYLLGGLSYQLIKETDVNENEGILVKNNFSYVLGVQLLVGDKKQLISHMRLNKVKVVEQEGQIFLSAILQRDVSLGIKDMTILACVYKENDSSPLIEKEFIDVRMAPNSSMNVLTEWTNEELEDGQYVLELKAKTIDEEWKWRREFKVINAKKMNDMVSESEIVSDLHPAKKLYKKSWSILMMLTLIVFVVCFIIIIYLKRGNSNEED